MTHGQSSIDLPPTLFSRTNNSVTVVCAYFNTLDQVLKSSDTYITIASGTSFINDSNWSFDSRVASITMRPRPLEVIAPPFNLVLEKRKVLEHLTLSLEEQVKDDEAFDIVVTFR